MKGIKIIIIATVLLGTTVGSNVYATTGNELYERCANYAVMSGNAPCDQSTVDTAMCGWYVEGVLDATIGTLYRCPSDGVTYDKIVLVVKKYLSEHPERLHLPGDKLVIEALKEAFPCK